MILIAVLIVIASARSAMASFPTGTIQIDYGAYSTNNRLAILTLTAESPSGIAQMKISQNDLDWAKQQWMLFTETTATTLISPGDGVKTIWVRFKDNAGKISATYADTILLDTKAPTGKVLINAGAKIITNLNVTLSLSAAGATSMKLSLDNGATFGDWEPFIATKKVTFPGGDGQKAVVVYFRDRTGNESQAPAIASTGYTKTLASTGITVPASSLVTSYTVTWSASPTTDIATDVTYVLQEATNAAFTAGLRVAYSGNALKTVITSRTKMKAYYYRVRAKKSGYAPSDWTTDVHGCAVAFPPTYTVESLLDITGQITSLATYSTNVFWSAGGLWKYSVADKTAPILLAPTFYTPTTIVVHGNYFYWVDAGSVGEKVLYKATLDGSQTVPLRQGSIVQSTTNQILVDDTAAYWTTGAGYYSSSVNIEKVPLDGSSPQVIYTSSGAVTGSIHAISMDDNYIYWLEPSVTVDGYTLFRVSKMSGTVENLCQGLVIQEAVFMDPSLNMAVGDNYVYLGSSGQVIKIPKAGGSPSVIAQGPEISSLGLTLYGSNLNWLNYSQSALPEYGGGEAILSAPTDSIGSFTIVAPILTSAKGLHASSEGLSWAEADQWHPLGYAYKLKRLSWGAANSDTLASGIFLSASDVASGQYYFSEIYSHFSQMGRISLTTGVREDWLGGLNNGSPTLVPRDNYLIFGDGSALKKVPVNGGRVQTLFFDAGTAEITFDQLYEKDGMIYVSSYYRGIYKIPVDGGNLTLLASDCGCSDIISIQDGYIYYGYRTGAYNGPAELHRIPVDGGTPEVVFKASNDRGFEAFDGVTTAYLSEWVWNDQYKFFKHDIATGQEMLLYTGRFGLIGMNTDALFYNFNGWIYRKPKDGGTWRTILTVPYPLTANNWINAGAEDFYFSVSYLDETQGYFSEIDLLKRLH